MHRKRQEQKQLQLITSQATRTLKRAGTPLRGARALNVRLSDISGISMAKGFHIFKLVFIVSSRITVPIIFCLNAPL